MKTTKKFREKMEIGKIPNLLFVLLAIMILPASSYALTFRTDISGPGVFEYEGVKRIAANSPFTISVYANNTERRTIWVSPFTFSGSVSIQWINSVPMTDSGKYYVDDSSIVQKFATSEFLAFWSVLYGVGVEIWDGVLPDRFSFVGATTGPGNFYPSDLGEIKILNWTAKSTSNSGNICIEQGEMLYDLYNAWDWVFDEPIPTFETVCWEVTPDGDAIDDAGDNCPSAFNPDQIDSDGNRIGDACDFICGDANRDETINITDVIYIIGNLYFNGSKPNPIERADVDHNVTINLLDASYILKYLYRGGPTPDCP